MGRCLFLLSAALHLALLATTAWAQQAESVPVVGVLMVAAGPNEGQVEALRKGLRELGYVDGRNIKIEYRGAQGHADQLPRLAEELVRLKVDVLVAGAEPIVRAARQATSTIPIVMVMYDYDPVVAELINSFNRPGGNITGLFTRQSELVGKRLELLKSALPGSVAGCGVLGFIRPATARRARTRGSLARNPAPADRIAGALQL